MTGARRTATMLVTGLLLAAALAYAGLAEPRPAFDPLAALLFTGLFLFSDALAIPVGVGYVNLAPTVAVGALLVLGPFVAVLIALVGSAVNIGVRWAFPERVGEAREPGGLWSLIRIGLTNAFLLTASLTAGATLYQAAGGPIPLRAFGPQVIGPYLLFVLTYALVNYGLAAAYVMEPGDPALLHRFLRALPMMSAYEITPQLLTPLLPLIYLGLGPVPFLLVAVGLASSSLGMRGLAVTGQRLERRVAEMNTLGALSQALASSLQTEDLLATLREQLPKILPVGGLYVGLWDSAKEVISFPLLLEKGRVAAWNPRQHGNGFSEHVIRTRQPLLLAENVVERARELGLDPPAVAASSWLVVPIIAGSQVLGVLGVYTLEPSGTRLTGTDRDLLITIATQLAVALHNARLYGQTDEALAQRVQQLSSILYTTGEGILLLDADTRVLTANRALAGFVGLEVAELTGRALAADDDLLARLGTSRPQLATDLAALHNGTELVKHVHTSGTPAQRDLERALAPVRASGGEVAGWLMILRDVSEEQALEHLRDDLTHMLVHDLRGPLGSILTSLALVQQMAPPGQPMEAEANEVLSLARSSGEHLMVMINQLLDVARIESGSVPLQRERVSAEELLSAAVLRLRPAAESAAIRLVAEAAPGLPELSVDTQLVGRVLDNLGDNAIKFSPNGSTVRLWVKAGNQPSTVLFGVSDQGPGIPKPAQGRLFEKFHRLPNIQGRRGGTGLGLAFCRLVVQAHDGEIWVESEEGRGSTFMVQLPAEGKESETPS